MAVTKITRRALLVGAGGAAVVAGASGLWLVSGRWRNRRYRLAVERGAGFSPSVYLQVQPDGEVVIWLNRSEMGQGVSTALPLIIAEELDADWSRVRIEQAVAGDGFDYGPMATLASASIRSQWTDLRRAGATARRMLVAAAARHWGVSARSCRTDNGQVLHDDSGRALGYGELADAAASERAPLRPALKQPAEFRLIGQPIARRDIPDKVTGRTTFGLDVRLPDMRFAALARAPVAGSALLDVDDADARAVPDVIDVIRLESAAGGGVAVLARHTHAAIRGRDALRARWQAPQGSAISDTDFSARLRDRLRAVDAEVARDDGGVIDALTSGATLAADYEVPFLAHAPMEPMNCVARVSDGRCEVWAPTQVPDDARRVAADVAGLPLHRVTVHTTALGGGFGRRAVSDFVAEAVAVAARSGQPVQTVWTREDDMRHGLYRDAAAQRLHAALDDTGLPVAWRHRVVSAVTGLPRPGDVNWNALMGTDDLPYHTGARRIEWAGVTSPLRTAIWRSVGYSYTTFAIESFVDELAAAANHDPLDYRLRLLPDGHRLAHCLERVAELSGWRARAEARSGAAPAGAPARALPRALGLAAVSCFDSHIALVVEVEVEAGAGTPVRVPRVWAAVDCGIAIQPDGAIAQIEGGIVFGLTAALHGRLTLRDGAVVEGNYDDYRLLRIDETPDITVELIPGADPPGGLGEVGVPPVAPAVANALAAAGVGRRRNLPLLTS